MGGPGSGVYFGLKRGRKPGTRHTPESSAAMSAAMTAHHAARRNRPADCDECGRPPDAGDALDMFRGQWLCNSCLVDEMEPLRIEDFTWTGTSNLGAACEEYGMNVDHEGRLEGPRGKRRTA